MEAPILQTSMALNAPTRLVIADDHAILRAGLRTLLSSHDDLAVVGEASDGLEAVALWQETIPSRAASASRQTSRLAALGRGSYRIPAPVGLWVTIFVQWV